MKLLYYALLCMPFLAYGHSSNLDYCKENGFDRSVLVSRQQYIIKALKTHDASLMAAQISFPVRINEGSKKYYYIYSNVKFKKHYDTLFEKPKVTRFLEKVKHVKKNDFICRYDGAGLFNGAFWLAPTKASKIDAINLF